MRHLLFYLHIDLNEFIVENAPRILARGLTNEVVNKERMRHKNQALLALVRDSGPLLSEPLQEGVYLFVF